MRRQKRCKDFWKRSRQPRNWLEKWRKRCNIWIGEIARLANEAGFNVTLEDLLGDSKTVQDIQPLCDEQVRAAVGGSGIFTQCLLDPSLLKIVDPESYKRCHFTQERLKG